ncbi:MAG TPA: hypothetical protein VF821_21975, partial [Lentzea sp.]
QPAGADHDPPADTHPTPGADQPNTGTGDHGDHGGTPSHLSPAGHDLTPQYDKAAMAAQGDSYQKQLEQIEPDPVKRAEYEELSKKLSTNLSADEAQRVADIRNQIKVHEGDIVTKVLNDGALKTYLPDQPHTAQTMIDRQQQMGGSIARGQDVVGINTPQGLRDGLALDDKGQGWSPTPVGAESAMQLRYKADADSIPASNVPFGGPHKHVPDWNQYGPRTESQYQSPQEQAHYEASQKQMAAAGGVATPYTNFDPFTGTGSTGGGVPEWLVDRGTPLPDRAEIWQVNKDGSERLHAVYDSARGWAVVPEKKP